MNPNNIVVNIEVITGIIIALSALIVTAIKQYFKIKQLIDELKLQKAKKQFQIISSPFMAIAEQTPQVLYDNLKYKPDQIRQGLFQINSNEGKALIVAQATIEKMKVKNQKQLKTLKIRNAKDGAQYVSDHYQDIVKPILRTKG